MPDHTPKLGNGTAALLLAALTVVLLVVTAPDIGLTWDEPAYIAGADAFAGWLGLLLTRPTQAFRAETIDTYWTVNHEHPPVGKIWAGLVWSAARYVLDDLTAHRLGAMLLVAFLVALLYRLLTPAYGRAAGLFAVAALLSMPRFFFHAHLLALDVPVAVGAFAVAFLFWKTVDRKEWWWGILLGIAWGLVVATKLNGVFIPIALGAWLLVFRRRRSLVARLFLMGVSAVLTFFVVWPWLYHQTWARVVEYVGFHVNHYPIGQWYLGHFSLPPPWHCAPVMLWAVVPLSVLLLAVAGMARAGKGQRDNGLAWLLIINAFVSILPFLFGRSLLYDNDRLFMPVYPFLAALAGIGFGWALSGLRRLAGRLQCRSWAPLAAVLLAVALLAPQCVALAGLYPHLLSYYSEGVGGLPGATRLGLETTYWCETYAAALPYINDLARPGDLIWVETGSADVLIYYQIHGRLRQDVRVMCATGTDLGTGRRALNARTSRPRSAFPGSRRPLSTPAEARVWRDPGAMPSSYPVARRSAASAFGTAAPQPVNGRFAEADWYIFQYRQTQYGHAGLRYLPLKTLRPKVPRYEVRFRGVPLMGLYRNAARTETPGGGQPAGR